MPIGNSRRHMQSHQIVVLMTRAAPHGVNTLPLWSAMDLHRVSMAVVPLTRKVSRGVAIHAARMVQDRDNCFESSSGAGIIRRHGFMNELGSGRFDSRNGKPQNQHREEVRRDVEG